MSVLILDYMPNKRLWDKFYCNSAPRARYCSGDSPSAPAPDPAMGEAALQSSKLAKEQWNWTKNVFAPWAMDISTQVVDSQLETAADARDQMKTQWNRYLSMYAPVEQRMVLDSFGYDYLNDEDAAKFLETMTANEKAVLADQYAIDFADLKVSDERAKANSTKTTTTTTTTGGAGGATTQGRVGLGPFSGGVAYNTPSGSYTLASNTNIGGAYGSRVIQIGPNHPYYAVAMRIPKNAEAVEAGAVLYGTVGPFANGQVTNIQAVGGGTTTTTTTGGGSTPQALSAAEQGALDARNQAELNAVDRNAQFQTDTRGYEQKAVEAETGRLRATILRENEMAKAATERDMQRQGLDPSSGRYFSTLARMQVSSAASQAGALTAERQQLKEGFRGQRAAVANMGRGYQASIPQSNATDIAAGNSAVGNVNNTGGAITSARMAALPGYGTAGSINAYNQQLNYAQANDNSGIWGMVGQVGGAAIAKWSSKDVKTGKKKVDHKSILEKVKGMPVEEWEYKDGVPGESPEDRHVGPYAEDMKARFGVGDGKTIHPADANGILLSAVKALAAKVEKLEARA